MTYDPGETSPEAIADSVSGTGFEATVKTKDDPDAGKGR